MKHKLRPFRSTYLMTRNTQHNDVHSEQHGHPTRIFTVIENAVKTKISIGIDFLADQIMLTCRFVAVIILRIKRPLSDRMVWKTFFLLVSLSSTIYRPLREKTWLLGTRQSKAQSRLKYYFILIFITTQQVKEIVS